MDIAKDLATETHCRAPDFPRAVDPIGSPFCIENFEYKFDASID